MPIEHDTSGSGSLIERLRQLADWMDSDDPYAPDDMADVMRAAADALEKLQMMDISVEIRERAS